MNIKQLWRRFVTWVRTKIEEEKQLRAEIRLAVAAERRKQTIKTAVYRETRAGERRREVIREPLRMYNFDVLGGPRDTLHSAYQPKYKKPKKSKYKEPDFDFKLDFPELKY